MDVRRCFLPLGQRQSEFLLSMDVLHLFSYKQKISSSAWLFHLSPFSHPIHHKVLLMLLHSSLWFHALLSISFIMTLVQTTILSCLIFSNCLLMGLSLNSQTTKLLFWNINLNLTFPYSQPITGSPLLVGKRPQSL